MDLARLKSLVVLAEEGHFTRAAERLHIAQPALSQQIRKLESEVGLALVDRTTRRVSITDAGMLLVDYARVMLRAADDATAALVELSVQEDLSFQLADALQRDALDLAFLTLDQSRTPLLESHPIASEALVAVLSSDHPLVNRKAVSLAQLSGERFATFRGRVEEAASAQGIDLKIAFETNSVLRQKALVAEGLAVAVLPRSDAEGPGPALATVPLQRPALQHVVHAAWRKGRRQSPA